MAAGDVPSAPAAAGSGSACPGYDKSGNCPGWVNQLLSALGAPITWANQYAIYLWALSEGSGISHNNPLAISGGGPGATGCFAQCGGSSPVTGFATMTDGVNATANFIKNGYPSIWKAFVAHVGDVGIWQAINESRWCRGCQNGAYPVVLKDAIDGQVTPTTGPGSIIPGGGSTAPGAGGSGIGPSPPDSCAWKGPFGWCIVTHSQVKAVKGAVLVAAGGTMFLLGGAVLVAFGFQASGAARAASQVVNRTPLGRVAKATGTRRRARRTEAVRQQRRAEATTDREAAAAARRYAAGAGSSSSSDLGPAFTDADRDPSLPTPAQRMNRVRVEGEERQRATRRDADRRRRSRTAA